MSTWANFSSAAACMLVLSPTFGVLAQATPTGAPTTWAIEVEGDCAEVRGFHAQLNEIVPPAARAEEMAEMRIHVRTELAEEGGRAQVDVFDAILQAPAGSRTLTAEQPGCGPLAEQLHLVIGILIEAGRGAPDPEPQPEPKPDPEPDPKPDPEPAPEPTQVAPAKPPASRRVRRLRVGPKRHYTLGLVGTAGWGLLPRVYPGAELRWTIAAGERWPIRLAGALEGPSEARTSAGAMRLFAGYGSLGVCPDWPVGRRSHMGGCALIGLGAIRADNVGFASFNQDRQALVLLGLEGFATIQIAGPWEVVLGVLVSGVPYIARFAYTNTVGVPSVAHQSSPVVVRGHGGLQLRFR